jgi:hypothetical protein
VITLILVEKRKTGEVLAAKIVSSKIYLSVVNLTYLSVGKSTTWVEAYHVVLGE